MTNNENDLIEYIRTQTSVLTTIGNSTLSTERLAAELLKSNQDIKTGIVEMATAQKEFRKGTFKILVYIILFLISIVTGLMLKLNIRGADEINAAKHVVEERVK